MQLFLQWWWIEECSKDDAAALRVGFCGLGAFFRGRLDDEVEGFVTGLRFVVEKCRRVLDEARAVALFAGKPFVMICFCPLQSMARCDSDVVRDVHSRKFAGLLGS